MPQRRNRTKIQFLEVPYNWPHQLSAGLAAMGIELTDEQQRKMLTWLTSLQKWNRTYNLTAIRDPEEMVARQLLDSLSILRLIEGPRVLDVGTGPGLPGIPLAIARPDIHFTLIDSNGKKSRFLQQSKIELKLINVEIVRGRVEQYKPKMSFNTLISRAFASLTKTVKLTSHLIDTEGIFVAMKGVLPRNEIAALEGTKRVIKTVQLHVPRIKGERHAVIIYPPQLALPGVRHTPMHS